MIVMLSVSYAECHYAKYRGALVWWTHEEWRIRPPKLTKRQVGKIFVALSNWLGNKSCFTKNIVILAKKKSIKHCMLKNFHPIFSVQCNVEDHLHVRYFALRFFAISLPWPWKHLVFRSWVWGIIRGRGKLKGWKKLTVKFYVEMNLY